MLVCFSQQLAWQFSSCGMAPVPYFKKGIVGDHSILFFTFVNLL